MDKNNCNKLKSDGTYLIWRGKRVTDLTKEELLEVVWWCAKEFTDMDKRFQEERKAFQ